MTVQQITMWQTSNGKVFSDRASAENYEKAEKALDVLVSYLTRVDFKLEFTDHRSLAEDLMHYFAITPKG